MAHPDRKYWRLAAGQAKGGHCLRADYKAKQYYSVFIII